MPSTILVGNPSVSNSSSTMPDLSRPISIGGHKRSKSDTSSLVLDHYSFPPINYSNVGFSCEENRESTLTRGWFLARRRSGRSKSIDDTSANDGGSSNSKGHVRKRSASVEKKMDVLFGRPPVDTGLKPLWPPEPKPMLDFVPATYAKEHLSRFSMIPQSGLGTGATLSRLSEDVFEDKKCEDKGCRRSTSVKHQVNGMNGINGASNRMQFRQSIMRRHSLLAPPSQEHKRRVSYMPLHGKLFDDRKPPKNEGTYDMISKPPATHAQRYVKVNRRYDSRFCDGCMTYITLDPVQYESADRENVNNGPTARLCANCRDISTDDFWFIGEEAEGDCFSVDIERLRNLHVAWDRFAIRDCEYLQPGLWKTEEEEMCMLEAAEKAVLSTTFEGEAEYEQWVAEQAEEQDDDNIIERTEEPSDDNIIEQTEEQSDDNIIEDSDEESDDKIIEDSEYESDDKIIEYIEEQDDDNIIEQAEEESDDNIIEQPDDNNDNDADNDCSDDKNAICLSDDETDEYSDKESFEFDSGSLESRSSGLTINEKRFSETPWAGIQRLRTWSLDSVSEHTESSDSASNYSIETISPFSH